jgi:hypothetical protein
MLYIAIVLCILHVTYYIEEAFVFIKWFTKWSNLACHLVKHTEVQLTEMDAECFLVGTGVQL